MGDLIDDDDDFGDIYADVECQAGSSINFISCVDTEPPEKGREKGGDCGYDSNAEQVKVKADEEIPGFLNSVCAKSSNSDDYMSDSEDDFNIVLNDEDCKGFSVAADGNGNRDCFDDGEEDDEFLCSRKGYGKNGLIPGANNDRGERGSEVKYNNKYEVYDSFGMASCSSQSVRGRWEDNQCKPQKVSNIGQLTSIHSSTNSAIFNGGHGFALPWYRTILDVNIDAFEEKRWMHPGVDISDFFNFGFDEDSWKKYCISLEKLRQQWYLQNRFYNYDYSYLSQACWNRPGSGRASEDIAQARSSSKFAEAGEKLLGLPKGRAIQVEDGTGERPSKMDVSCPRVLDSDVVIQINVQDPDEDCCGSCEDKLHHTDNEGIGSSTVTNLNVDDAKDVHDFDGSSADASLKHLRNPVSESNEMNLSPDDPDNHRDSNAQTSEDIDTANETVVKAERENGKTVCESDDHVAEIEESGGERSHFSLTLSCSESESEASQDSVYNLPEASDRILSKQSSEAKLLELDSPDRKSPKRNDVVKKQDNCRHFSRCRSPIWEGRRYQQGRLHKMEREGDFGNNNKHNILFNHGREFSGQYGGERFAKIHSRDLRIRNPRFRNDQNCRNEAESQRRRNWIDENFHERRTYDKYGLDEDWDFGEGALSPRDTISFSYGQSRRSFSKYDQWRGKRGGIEPGKQTNDDMFFLDHQNMDYDMPYRRRRPILFNQEKEFFNEVYENIVPSVGREAYLYERRDKYRCRSPMDLDGPWGMEFEDEHWDHNSHDLSYRHYRETYAANRGTLRNKMSPRSDISDPGCDEIYRDYHRAENYDDYDNIEGDIACSDDQAHRRWRKYGWKSRILHQVECESILTQHDDVSYFRRSSNSHEKSFRHEKLWENRSKMLKRETNASFYYRKPLVTSRAERDLTAWRYSNPVDKSYGRKLVKEQKLPRDSRGFHSRRATQCISKLDGKDDKFTGTEQKIDIDIKEGQSMPEERIKEGRHENKKAPENTVFEQSTKKRTQSENVIDKGYDEQRILDTLAKMEKRRQRFQNPVALKIEELDSTLKPQFDSRADSVEVENKQERPARKRRWVG